MINYPEELIDAVIGTLTAWYEFHTDPNTWADEWSMGEYSHLLSVTPVISNTYFSFDLRKACQIKVAEEWELVRCDNCGGIYSRFDGCGEEDECYDSDYSELSPEELGDYISDIDVSCESIPEWIIEDVMIHEAFPAYSAGVGRVISRVIDEIEDFYSAMELAETNLDRLIVAVNALQIMHVNGNIADDYGDKFDLDYVMVNTLRTDGLSGLFSDEEIAEFAGLDVD